MQHRTAILLVCTSLLLLTTKAQRSHHDNHRIDAYDSFQEKELEQNLNSLQHEQLFLPNKGPLSSLSSELNKDKLQWITLPRMSPSQHSDKLNKNLPSRQHPPINKNHKQLEQRFKPKRGQSSSLSSELNKDKLEWITFPRINPLTRRDRPQKMNQSRQHHPTTKDHSKLIKLSNTQSYRRRATRGYRGMSNKMKQESQPSFQQHLHPVTPDIYPRKRRISRFQLGRKKGANREHGRSQEVQSKKKTHMKSGKYPKSLPKSLHRLDLGSHQSHKQKGQQRSARSSCTGGKVWRRGQCRCPSLSNWDEKKSECVCIYGTYKDANGNCRSFS